MKKGPHLLGAAKKRFLGGDHHNVGIRRKELHDTLGIPRRERGAEALQDLEQLGLRLHIRPHDQAICQPPLPPKKRRRPQPERPPDDADRAFWLKRFDDEEIAEIAFSSSESVTYMWSARGGRVCSVLPLVVAGLPLAASGSAA